MPRVEPILVEPIHPVPVYGLKGVGEHAVMPAAPAVRNAILNAIGIPINELPMTMEKILLSKRKASS
jgi:carbon-monoxide dehydrogenase large subunit